MIDYLGMTFHPSSSGVYLSVFKGYLEESVKLMSETFPATIFDNAQEFQKLIKQSITEIEMAEKDPNIISEQPRKVLYHG